MSLANINRIVYLFGCHIVTETIIMFIRLLWSLLLHLRTSNALFETIKFISFNLYRFVCSKLHRLNFEDDYFSHSGHWSDSNCHHNPVAIPQVALHLEDRGLVDGSEILIIMWQAPGSLKPVLRSVVLYQETLFKWTQELFYQYWTEVKT